MTTDTIFVDDNNNIISEPKTKGAKTMPKTTKVTKTKSATKVVKTTTKTKSKASSPAPVVATTTTKRPKRNNKMVEIVAMAKEKGYEPVLVGKCLKTLPCRKCGKKAVLFTNGVKKILACTCGHREGR